MEATHVGRLVSLACFPLKIQKVLIAGCTLTATRQEKNTHFGRLAEHQATTLGPGLAMRSLDHSFVGRWNLVV
jgi:hypothetical protein